MARITCPECNGKSGHSSWGDGWSEWEECPCCNADGTNDTGFVSEQRVEQYRRHLADEEAYWERRANAEQRR